MSATIQVAQSSKKRVVRSRNLQKQPELVTEKLLASLKKRKPAAVEKLFELVEKLSGGTSPAKKLKLPEPGVTDSLKAQEAPSTPLKKPKKKAKKTSAAVQGFEATVEADQLWTELDEASSGSEVEQAEELPEEAVPCLAPAALKGRLFSQEFSRVSVTLFLLVFLPSFSLFFLARFVFRVETV